MDINIAKENLKKILFDLGSFTVAFSGGVDSTFLLRLASEILGDRVAAITVISPMFPQRELKEAIQFTKKYNIKHIIIDYSNDFIYPENNMERCYNCKYKIFSKIIDESNKDGYNYVIDGTNFDDLNDYRPGMRALKELNVKSPLLEEGFTKAMIRECLKEYGLEIWHKPALACLATRIPLGTPITKESLKMIENAENILKDMGFVQFRVRHHGDIARIEVAKDERAKFFDIGIMELVDSRLKEAGFKYVSLDLSGYKTGNMNL